MQNVVYVGLDAGSSTCHAIGMNPEGAIVLDRKFATSEANLISVFSSIRGQVHVHLESGELAEWIVRVLKPRVFRVVVGHAKTSAWITKDPLKRDRLDATKLADLLRMNRVHQIYQAEDQGRTVFKQIGHHYDDVTAQQAALKQKVKARFRVQGVIPRGDAVYTPAGRTKWLRKVQPPLAREALVQLYELLDRTVEAQKKARALLRRMARSYPEIALFDEVPGIGLINACRFSAYIQTPHRFSSKRKMWRYCRLGMNHRSQQRWKIAGPSGPGLERQRAVKGGFLLGLLGGPAHQARQHVQALLPKVSGPHP